MITLSAFLSALVDKGVTFQTETIHETAMDYDQYSAILHEIATVAELESHLKIHFESHLSTDFERPHITVTRLPGESKDNDENQSNWVDRAKKLADFQMLLSDYRDRGELKFIAERYIMERMESYVVFSDYICAMRYQHTLTLIPFMETNDAPEDAVFGTLANLFNPENPYFDEEIFVDNEFFVTRYSTEMLNQIVSDIVITSKDIPVAVTAVTIKTPIEDDDIARIAFTDDDWNHHRYVSDRDHDLFKYIIKIFNPGGNAWEYNDYNPGRLSGYTNCQESYIIELEPRSNSSALRLGMKLRGSDKYKQANDRLRKFFLENKAPEEILRLLASPVPALKVA